MKTRSVKTYPDTVSSRLSITPAHILLLFREKVAFDWTSLCKALGFYHCVEDLRNRTECDRILSMFNGLIRAKLLTRKSPKLGLKSPIEVSTRWIQIQKSLDISLMEVALLNQKSLIVQPFHGKPDTKPAKQQLDIFVLMPFNEELKPIYQDHIKRVATKLKLKVQRADESFTPNLIMKDIWNSICTARLIIADCTDKNPNVFYEIGLAHAVGKPIILVTQNSDHVPFDLAHIRYIPYSYSPRGMKEFEFSLTETLRLEFGNVKEKSNVYNCPHCSPYLNH
jgi:hypothetical protein